MNTVHDNSKKIATARRVLSAIDLGRCFGLNDPALFRLGAGPALCFALGLPHDVDPVLRLFGLMLSGSPWCSSSERATGMRKLAVAQLGSQGKLDSITFAQKLAEQTIRRLLPPLLRRQIRLNNVADRCEQEGTEEAADAAYFAAYAAYTPADIYVENSGPSDWRAADRRARADAAHSAAEAVRYTAEASYAAAEAAKYAGIHYPDRSVAYAAYAACSAAYAASEDTKAWSNYTAKAADAARDGVLLHMCDICIDILRDMKAPGIDLMEQVC